MRKGITILLLWLCSLPAFAGHITGGEMYYVYNGMVNGRHQYSVTLKFYKRCGISTAFPDPAIVSVFNKTDLSRVEDIYAPLSRQENIRLGNINPCISNPPNVCFDVAYYNFTVLLPGSPAGYILASQVNFRINGMNNLVTGYSGIGAMYTAEIPGTTPPSNAPNNSSARFTGSDLVLVCTGNPFSYSFAATDPDGDQLRYSFCGAFRSSSQSGSAPPPDPPPYSELPYQTPAYSASSPMGSGITINTNTGLVQGTAPAPGQYVVTVCVEEIRRGAILSTQRKDIQINVADCSVAGASLLPEYSLCKSSMTLSLENRNSSPVITRTDWEIRDRAGNLVHQLNGAGLVYNFPDTGLYSVKLVVNRNLSCADSTNALVRVYPGFVPDFSFTGGCVNRPSFFRDESRSVYGIPDSWQWDFGELTDNGDQSALQQPAYTYPQTGDKTVQLIVTDSRGCRDTLTKNIQITNGAPIGLAFRDTLICRNDPLELRASGNGRFNWSPSATVADPGNPVTAVFPQATTTYFVDLDNGGCINRDSVRVRVVDFVTLLVADTTVCRGDQTTLKPVTDGLQFQWSPAALVSSPTVKEPIVNVPTATLFTITALIGGCSDTKSFTVRPVPYPFADAGPDQSVCAGNPALLTGQTDGSAWSWSPAGGLDDPFSLRPTVTVNRTTEFILSVTDTLGCPKPARDTVRLTVFPKPPVFAGRDTAVLVNQPLQLNATGGISYQWSPATGLSDPGISNPIARFSSPGSGFQYRVRGTDTAGCQADAFIRIRVFQTGPMVFVPTAFTPNRDGLNDELRPQAAGILDIAQFTVFNRWGQAVFTTRQSGKGWDGRFNGAEQAPGTYVWQVVATDYLGKPYFSKGTVTLIR